MENNDLFKNEQKKSTYNQLRMESKIIFLSKIYENVTKINIESIEKLDRDLEITLIEKNPEILLKFYLIGINLKYDAVINVLP